jgi:sulfide:quinone oxidoreductase
VIQGVLFTDREPAYLQAPLVDGGATLSDPRASSLWWPPSKIAGRHLSPYLAIAGPPEMPEIRPDAKSLAVTIDVQDVVRSIRGVLDGDAVPPG